jgi:hypothetical protein
MELLVSTAWRNKLIKSLIKPGQVAAKKEAAELDAKLHAELNASIVLLFYDV